MSSLEYQVPPVLSRRTCGSPDRAVAFALSSPKWPAYNTEFKQKHQQLSIDGVLEYDVWLTRGIIIDLGDREIGFEKDTWLSLEIFIHKGTDVLTKFISTDTFVNGDWSDNCVATCEREIIRL